MIKLRVVNNQFMASKGRDDFGFYDPRYTEIEQTLSRSTYPMRSLEWCCSSIKNGLTPAKEEYSVETTDTDALIIKVANLTNSGLDFSDEKLSFVPEEVYMRVSKRAKAKLSDVLVLCAAHQRKYIGKRVDIIDALPIGFETRTVVVAELLILRVKPERIDPYYLLSCLRLPIIQELVNKYVRGQTGHLYPTDLKELEIPVPEELETQQAIARIVYDTEAKAKGLRDEIRNLEDVAARTLSENILNGLSHGAPGLVTSG
jgi:hypothetical protein